MEPISLIRHSRIIDEVVMCDSTNETVFHSHDDLILQLL